ncbi:hypothetical protein M2351_008470 [Azospirillum canadense]|nr:hypothetical protein [Azospirillum canadense]
MRMAGQDGLVVARTLAGTPAYDLRLADGRVVKYAAETDFEVVEPGDAPRGARPSSSPNSSSDRPRD